MKESLARRGRGAELAGLLLGVAPIVDQDDDGGDHAEEAYRDHNETANGIRAHFLMIMTESRRSAIPEAMPTMSSRTSVNELARRIKSPPPPKKRTRPVFSQIPEILSLLASLSRTQGGYHLSTTTQWFNALGVLNYDSVTWADTQ